MLFDNPNAFAAIAVEFDPEDPQAGREHFCGISFSMNEQFAIHPEEVAAAEQFGWPVPAPEAWPSTFSLQSGQLSPVTTDQLRFLPVAIKAVTERLTGAAEDGTAEFASGEKNVRVTLEKL